MVAVMGIAASGAVGVLLAMPGATPVVVAAAAAYFAYLAVRIALAPPLAEGAAAGRRPSFGAGLFLSLVNPKGYAAMAALFSGFALVRERLVLDALLKALVLLAVMIAVNVAWLLTGASLTRLFRDPRSNRVINLTFAVLLLATVAAALLI
jgi:threonine/homoserine/homoserine lactone efflux protein